MSRTKTFLLGVVLCLVLSASSEAAGLGRRNASRTSRRGQRASTSQTHVQLNRGRTGYRRSPSATQRTTNRRGSSYKSSERSTLRRGLSEVFGYDARDSLAMGAGRRAGRSYQDPRDRAVANQTTRRVVGYAGRIGNSLRRIIQR